VTVTLQTPVRPAAIRPSMRARRPVLLCLLLAVVPVAAQKPLPGAGQVADATVSRQADGTLAGGWSVDEGAGRVASVRFALYANGTASATVDRTGPGYGAGVTRYVWSGRDRTGRAALHSDVRLAGVELGNGFAAVGRAPAVPPAVATHLDGHRAGALRELQSLLDGGAQRSALDRTVLGFERAAGREFGQALNAHIGAVKRRGGQWRDPRSVLGRDGRASDDFSSSAQTRTDDGGSRHVSTSTSSGKDGTVSMQVTIVERDASGRETSRTSLTISGDSMVLTSHTSGAGGSASTSMAVSGGVSTWAVTVVDAKGGVVHDAEATTRRSTGPTRSPAEGSTPAKGYEAELAQWMPWMAESLYRDWARRTELLLSGGRLAQPGRGGDRGQVTAGETPRPGTQSVINCGDSANNPCAQVERAARDPKGGFGAVSQPGREVPPLLPAPSPKPPPGPQPKP
jgi:hypothetical protein